MEPPVEVRIGKLLEIRSSKLPPNHPLQPQTIQPLNMIVPDKPEDDSVLNNLSSHLSGELPNVDINLQKASEVTTSEVASENQHQSEPNPEQSSTTVLEKPSSEPNVPKHYVLEQTGYDHISSSTHSENAMESDGMILSEDLYEETEQSSHIEVEQSAFD